MGQVELKRLQDQELSLLKQYEIQKQESTQAEQILKEALGQMDTMRKEISETKKRWNLTLKMIEDKTITLKQELEVSVSEL